MFPVPSQANGNRNTRRSRKLHFESLEGRALLAGNVTAAVTGGDLIITGDAEANSIVIVHGRGAGEYLVKGVDGTTINGAGSSFRATGVTANVSIALDA